MRWKFVITFNGHNTKADFYGSKKTSKKTFFHWGIARKFFPPAQIREKSPSFLRFVDEKKLNKKSSELAKECTKLKWNDAVYNYGGISSVYGIFSVCKM